MAKRKNTKDK